MPKHDGNLANNSLKKYFGNNDQVQRSPMGNNVKLDSLKDQQVLKKYPKLEMNHDERHLAKPSYGFAHYREKYQHKNHLFFKDRTYDVPKVSAMNDYLDEKLLSPYKRALPDRRLQVPLFEKGSNFSKDIPHYSQQFNKEGSQVDLHKLGEQDKAMQERKETNLGHTKIHGNHSPKMYERTGQDAP